MEMADEKWKIAGDLCRCCLAVGSHNKLGIAKFNDKASGDNEDFANMLLENLGLTLLPVKCVLSEITYTICNPCVERLRDAVSFRKQVQLSEEKFWNMYGRNMLIAIEPIVVKVEDVEPEDAYKGASDDDFTMDDFSDDDTKLNFIEIKAETKKSKGKAKAGIKGTATKKPPTRKMAARKTKTKSMMDAESVKAQKQKVKTEKTEAIKTEEEEEGSPAEETKPPVKRKKDEPASKVPLSAKPTKSSARSKPTETDGQKTESSVYSCDECDIKVTVKRRLNIHKLFHHKLEKCKHCPMLFTRRKMLGHIKSAHPTEIPTCGICGYQNPKQADIDKHQRYVHMREKNFNCDKCDMKFFYDFHLRQHQKVHSDERPFKCEFCHKRFKQSATLYCHRKIHTGEKNKVCPVCAQAFVQKASLNHHMKKQHPEARF